MVSIQTVKQIAIERAKECAEEIGNKFLHSVRPIYGTDERSVPNPVPVGTCMFLKVGGEHFMITAAHVMDNNSVSTLYLGAGNSLLPINGYFWATAAPDGDRKRDKLDFAFWRLTPDVVENIPDVAFIDELDLSQNRGTMGGRQFLAMGYPVSRNKKISAKDRRALAKAWTYQASHFDPDDDSLLRMGFSRTQHLFLEYNGRTGNYEGAVDNAINPLGASGGALLDLGLPSLADLPRYAPCVGRLAGLFIERNKHAKVLAFLKIGVIVEQIRASLGDNNALAPKES